MGLKQAFSGSISGTLADQWRDVVSAGPFGEHTVVAPGVYRQTNNGRGTNDNGSTDVLSNGSKILVPVNTAAFIFSQAGIEEIITEPGGYEYRNGQSSLFAGDGLRSSLLNQAVDRMRYGGQTADQKNVAFVNLREIRGIKFGTRGPMIYHDAFYGADLEIRAYGTYSIQVVNPVAFVQNFLPPNVRKYSFGTPEAHLQLSSEFMQAFVAAVSSFSERHRVAELPSQAAAIADHVADDSSTLGSWIARFGLDVVQVGIESIELSPESRAIVQQFSENRMRVSAYEGVSQHASNISAQQKVAEGVQKHGLGDAAGMVFGMNLAQSHNPAHAVPTPPPFEGSTVAAGSLASLDQQIELVRKLKELHDQGVLSEAEFNQKKAEIMGL